MVKDVKQIIEEPITKAASYGSAQTDTAVWTPEKDKRIVLLGFMFSTAIAGSIRIKANNADVIPPVHLAGNGYAHVNSTAPIWRGTLNQPLTVTSTISGSHSILLWGYEE